MAIDYDTLHVEPSDELFESPEVSKDFVDDETYDKPDGDFLKSGRRKRGAAEYENKVKGSLNNVMRMCLASQSTVPDAAALIAYGSNFSRAMGDWAADNEMVRKGIDFLAGGTESPGAVAIATGLPIVLQILRNHETSAKAEVPVKRIRIPFTKRYLTVKFKIRLGKRLRNMTNDPQEFTHWVFSNPDIRQALKKQGIQLAGEDVD